MNEISPDQLLSQIRSMRGQLQMPQAPTRTAAPSGPEFGDLLKGTLDAVSDAQKTARELQIGFQNGTTDKSLAEVVIATEKAGLARTAVFEVRNKLITAYQDIMNMPV